MFNTRSSSKKSSDVQGVQLRDRQPLPSSSPVMPQRKRARCEPKMSSQRDPCLRKKIPVTSVPQDVETKSNVNFASDPHLRRQVLVISLPHIEIKSNIMSENDPCFRRNIPVTSLPPDIEVKSKAVSENSGVGDPSLRKSAAATSLSHIETKDTAIGENSSVRDPRLRKNVLIISLPHTETDSTVVGENGGVSAATAPIVCRVCGQAYSDCISLAAHKTACAKSLASFGYRCYRCLVSFSTQIQLFQHLKIAHHEEKKPNEVPDLLEPSPDLSDATKTKISVFKHCTSETLNTDIANNVSENLDSGLEGQIKKIHPHVNETISDTFETLSKKPNLQEPLLNTMIKNSKSVWLASGTSLKLTAELALSNPCTFTTTLALDAVDFVHVCESCKVVRFKTLQELRLHEDWCGSSKATAHQRLCFECVYCHRKYHCKPVLSKHMEECSKSSENKRGTISFENPYDFTTVYAPDYHNFKFFCTSCHVVGFETAEKANLHEMWCALLRHRTKDGFECPACGLCFRNQLVRNKHQTECTVRFGRDGSVVLPVSSVKQLMTDFAADIGKVDDNGRDADIGEVAGNGKIDDSGKDADISDVTDNGRDADIGKDADIIRDAEIGKDTDNEKSRSNGSVEGIATVSKKVQNSSQGRKSQGLKKQNIMGCLPSILRGSERRHKSNSKKKVPQAAGQLKNSVNDNMVCAERGFSNQADNTFPHSFIDTSSDEPPTIFIPTAKILKGSRKKSRSCVPVQEGESQLKNSISDNINNVEGIPHQAGNTPPCSFINTSSHDPHTTSIESHRFQQDEVIEIQDRPVKAPEGSNERIADGTSSSMEIEGLSSFGDWNSLTTHKCVVCDEVTSCVDDLKEHIKEISSVDALSSSEASDQNILPRGTAQSKGPCGPDLFARPSFTKSSHTSCLDCNTLFESRLMLSQHKKICPGKTGVCFLCAICVTVFDNYLAYNEHVKQSKGNIESCRLALIAAGRMISQPVVGVAGYPVSDDDEEEVVIVGEDDNMGGTFQELISVSGYPMSEDKEGQMEGDDKKLQAESKPLDDDESKAVRIQNFNHDHDYFGRCRMKMTCNSLLDSIKHLGEFISSHSKNYSNNFDGAFTESKSSIGGCFQANVSHAEIMLLDQDVITHKSLTQEFYHERSSQMEVSELETVARTDQAKEGTESLASQVQGGVQMEERIDSYRLISEEECNLIEEGCDDQEPEQDAKEPEHSVQEPEEGVKPEQDVREHEQDVREHEQDVQEPVEGIQESEQGFQEPEQGIKLEQDVQKPEPGVPELEQGIQESEQDVQEPEQDIKLEQGVLESEQAKETSTVHGSQLNPSFGVVAPILILPSVNNYMDYGDESVYAYSRYMIDEPLSKEGEQNNCSSEASSNNDKDERVMNDSSAKLVKQSTDEGAYDEDDCFIIRTSDAQPPNPSDKEVNDGVMIKTDPDVPVPLPIHNIVAALTINSSHRCSTRHEICIGKVKPTCVQGPTDRPAADANKPQLPELLMDTNLMREIFGKNGGHRLRLQTSLMPGSDIILIGTEDVRVSEEARVKIEDDTALRVFDRANLEPSVAEGRVSQNIAGIESAGNVGVNLAAPKVASKRKVLEPEGGQDQNLETDNLGSGEYQNRVKTPRLDSISRESHSFVEPFNEQQDFLLQAVCLMPRAAANAARQKIIEQAEVKSRLRRSVTTHASSTLKNSTGKLSYLRPARQKPMECANVNASDDQAVASGNVDKVVGSKNAMKFVASENARKVVAEESGNRQLRFIRNQTGCVTGSQCREPSVRDAVTRPVNSKAAAKPKPLAENFQGKGKIAAKIREKMAVNGQEKISVNVGEKMVSTTAKKSMAVSTGMLHDPNKPAAENPPSSSCKRSSTLSVNSRYKNKKQELDSEPVSGKNSSAPDGNSYNINIMINSSNKNKKQELSSEPVYGKSAGSAPDVEKPASVESPGVRRNIKVLEPVSDSAMKCVPCGAVLCSIQAIAHHVCFE